MNKYIVFSFALVAVHCGNSANQTQSKNNVNDTPANQDVPIVNNSEGQSSTSSSSGSVSSSSSSSSGSTSSGSVAHDAGSDAQVETLGSCIAACETKYPVVAAKAKDIDKCWVEKCPVDCSGIGTSNKLFSPMIDGSTCTTLVQTPSQACSDCTAANCCEAWDGCYGNPDCNLLSACANTCYSRFN